MADPRVEILTNWMDEYSVIDGQFARDQATRILAALDAVRAPDPRDEVIRGLCEALAHMQWRRHCGEGPWEDCEGGRDALVAIAEARKLGVGE